MTKKTIYISGPMSGLPDFNFPAFYAEAARLEALGCDVVNPATINPETSLSWCECMRRDIAALVFCDAVQLLPGWQKSQHRLNPRTMLGICTVRDWHLIYFPLYKVLCTRTAGSPHLSWLVMLSKKLLENQNERNSSD